MGFTRQIRLGCSVAGLWLAATAMLAVPASLEAAPITYGFRTSLASPATDPYGTGSFTFDDAAFPFPHMIVFISPPGVNPLLNFEYTDPHVGSFTTSNVAAFHFEIGLTPTTSLFAFVIASPDNSRSLIGSVSGDPPVQPNTNSTIDYTNQKQLTVYFPEPVPEPASLLLVGTGLAGVTALRRRRRARRHDS